MEDRSCATGRDKDIPVCGRCFVTPTLTGGAGASCLRSRRRSRQTLSHKNDGGGHTALVRCCESLTYGDRMSAKIINRGRGPEIEGTRITVYDVLDYARQGWHRDVLRHCFACLREIYRQLSTTLTSIRTKSPPIIKACAHARRIIRMLRTLQRKLPRAGSEPRHDQQL